MNAPTGLLDQERRAGAVEHAMQADTPPDGALHLELAGVSLRYGEVRALERVSLRVPAGRIVALIGANGAGKSSTLRAITGLRRVAEGEVRLEGRVINAPQAQEPTHALVRPGVAMV